MALEWVSVSVESECWDALGSWLSQPRRGASPEAAAGPALWTSAFCVSFTWAWQQCKHQFLQEFSHPVFSMWCSFDMETRMGNTACGAQTTWPRNRATAISSLFHVASARVPATQWERVSLLLGETEAQSSAPGSGPCQVQFCCLPLQSNSRKHELVF